MISSPMFHFRLFGSPSLVREDGALLTGRAVQRHRLALLALLALSSGRSLSRDALMAHLWPERDTDHARLLLNQAVHTLRKAVGASVLLSTGDELRLGTGVLRADVIAFQEALASGDPERAVGLYAGPLLDGFFLSGACEFERWVEREREHLARCYARALEGLAEAAEGKRDFGSAVEWWKARAVHDPYDSRVAIRLMQALDANGHRAGALQQAALHQRLLQEDFGVEAPPEVRAEAERLQSQPLAQAPALHQPSEPAGDQETMPSAPPDRTPEAAASASSPPAEPEDPRPEAAIEGGTGYRRRWLRAAALLATFSLVGAAVSAVWPHGVEPERSIVVLPFVNLSPNGDAEYFSDGLSEEIITRLSTVPGLKVISRTSAMHYKGSDKPLRQVAEELNVAHVLEGTARRSDDGHMRISAQLVDASADEQLWAESYDYSAQDIFRAQEGIAREVVRALEVELGERGRSRLSRQGTRDPVAHELYRRGRFLWTTRTREGHARAMEYFQQAIERDSRYADAYAGMADVYLTAYQLGLSELSEEEVYSRLKWAAERALALDDQSADAHTAFAISLWWQRNWPGAERELRRALELNPGHASARGWYAVLLAGMGRMEEALRESRRAAELDPFALIISINYGWACSMAREYDCAITQYRRTLELNPAWAPAYAQLGLAYAHKGMYEAAIRQVQKAVELRPQVAWYRADLAYVYALSGRKAEARQHLQRATAMARDGFGFPIASAYAALGEPDSAFVWLERNDWQWSHRGVRAAPALDPLRSDPRFAELVTRVDREMGIR